MFSVVQTTARNASLNLPLRVIPAVSAIEATATAMASSDVSADPAPLTPDQTVTLAESVLEFWFEGDPTANRDWWFTGGSEIDDRIRDQFADETVRLARGDFETPWLEEGSFETTLAYIIVADQFSRNVYRGDGRSFATDAQGLAAAQLAMDRGWLDGDLTAFHHMFATMPFMHAESMDEQIKSVELTTKACQRWPEELGPIGVSFADMHLYIVEQFGRFPDRNGPLGRENTPEEEEFLAQGGMHGLFGRWADIQAERNAKK